MSRIHTFLVDPVEEARVEMALALGDGQLWVGHDSLPQLAQSIDEGNLPAVVLIGPGIVHDDTIMLAESIQEERLPVRIVQFTKALDPDRLRDALRAGVADVVEVGAGYDEVQRAIERSQRDLRQRDRVPTATATEPAPPTPIVAVVAGKGGVGASLVTSNIAVALAGRGLDVALIDMDVASGDLAIMFQKRPALTLLDALDRIDHMDADALDGGYLTPVSEHLRLMAAPLEGGAVHLPTGPFMHLLDLVGEVADIVVVDVGDAHDETARAVLAQAREILVVTTHEVTAVRGTRRVLTTLESMGLLDSSVRVVANLSDAPTGLSTSDLEKGIKAKVGHRIPMDKHATRSINQGDPLVQRRRSKAGQSLGALAGDLVAALGLDAR